MFMNFTYVIKRVLLQPHKFFKKDATRITSWKHPVYYVVLFSFFAAFFLAFDFFKSDFLAEYLPFSVSLWVIFIAFFIVLVLSSFLRYYIIHVFVRLWNKKAEYKVTYKALAYGTTPGWLSIPFFALSLYVYSLANDLLLFAVFLLLLGISLCFEGYAMYVRSIGLSKLQKISVLRSFLSIYVFGFVCYFVALFVIEFILLFPFFLLYLS